MNQPQYNELIESVASSKLIELLDMVKNEIADARNGEWTTEARKLAIASIDEKLYNKVKQVINSGNKPKKDDYFDNML